MSGFELLVKQSQLCALPDIYTLASSIMQYQVKHFCLCYNLHITTPHLCGFDEAAWNHICFKYNINIWIVGFGDSAHACKMDTPTSCQKQIYRPSTLGYLNCL